MTDTTDTTNALMRRFEDIRLDDVPMVGGKNASLGEMYSRLSGAGIRVPNGFATTADAYWRFIDANGFREKLASILSGLDTDGFTNLADVGRECRELVLSGTLPDELKEALAEGYGTLAADHAGGPSLAVRSSATAEDLPHASFAGQQETFLNVRGIDNLNVAFLRCYASLFTDRAIQYRVINGFEHMKVALSVGVQIMVRADDACSGVMFTLDPDSGFENVVLISGSWGLGENVVQGNVITDEFLLFKPLLGKVSRPVISRRLGSKELTMIFAENASGEIVHSDESTVNVETPQEKRDRFVLIDEEAELLARWAVLIQEHYGRHMDIEWAKDGASGEIFIVQARPETVHSIAADKGYFVEHTITKRGRVLCSGMGLGNRVAVGNARILYAPSEIDKLREGEILVTTRTDPDWDPVLKKAAAIVTDQGGRTSHAAIVAREVGAVAVVGTGNATTSIPDGSRVSVSAAEGETGYVYDGEIEWEEKRIHLDEIGRPSTKAMLILGHPERAFKYSFLPNDGVGLMRMEFIINNAIRVHPMALRRFEELQDAAVREEIEALTGHYPDKSEYFVRTLAESTARIAAAFHPKDVIVRMSDFKSNEYANLIGGRSFEPKEANPMIGFRGASRYYHPLYRDAFELECRAMKMVREAMGLTNVKLMIPFCRTVQEGEKVIELMESFGLKRGENGLELYVMIEIPSNAILADEFAKHFDGFSIGSNDLTQLTLGADRDSELLSGIFSPFDPAVQELIRMTIRSAKKAGVKVGLCGQAPSDYPDFARFLVEEGIDSISFNPDALVRGIENICRAEEV